MSDDDFDDSIPYPNSDSIPGATPPFDEPPPAANGKDTADPLKAADLPTIVLALLGEPTTRGDPHWRYGRKSSLSIHMPTGKWFDHEAGKGGRLAALVLRERGGTQDEAQAWLADRHYTVEDAARLETKIKADQARNLARQAKARKEATRLVDAGADLFKRHPDLTRTHDYLKRKGIAHLDLGLTVVSRSNTSIRGLPEGHVLIVPMRDHPHGVLHSVEAIAGNGTKRFLKGSRTAGCFHMIGDDGTLGTVLVCEGLATGASLYEATGLPVVVCFSCGNMAAVARIFARQGRVVICGDDDWSKPRNVGKERAIALHKELKRSWPNYGHALALPEFPGVERFADHKDFNDSVRACGLEAVRDVIKRAIEREAKPDPDPEPPPDVGESPPDQTPPPRLLRVISSADWQDKPVPQRRWAVRNRIPMRAVTILAGDGGKGKTMIALQLCYAVRRGTDWLGAIIDEGGPALFFTAEETEEEVQRRLEAIHSAFVTQFRDVPIDVISTLPNDADDDRLQDPCLGVPNKSSNRVEPTSTFNQLLARVREIGAKIVVIESVADCFAVHEIDRQQARGAIAIARRLALTCDCAVVLLAHASRAGNKDGSATSGSTQWRNAVRSFLTLGPVSEAEGDASHQLTVHKANYGPTGETVRLVWDKGIYKPQGTPGSAQAAAAEAQVDDAFLACLEAVTAQRVPVGASTSTNYAPAIFEGRTEAKGAKRKALAAAMDRLFKAGRIQTEESGPPSRRRSRLIRVK
jgi:phage/plasmid primase-like uncharacterized protein